MHRLASPGSVVVAVVFAVSLSFAVCVAGAGPAAAKQVEGVVNLNTAPPEALSLLPGVGPSKALGIVAYRQRRPFRTIDELVRVKGIGRRMVRELRGHLAVSGPSTIRNAAGAAAPPLPAPAAAATPPRPGPPERRAVVLRPPFRPPLGRAPPRPRVVERPVRSPANHCAPPP